MTDWRNNRPEDLPLLLAAFHAELIAGQRRNVRLPVALEPSLRRDIVTGAGFAIVGGQTATVTTLEAFTSLPDTVGRHMSLLICGLNPSPASAEARVGFARPGNRFWPAALAAGIVSVDRDPQAALNDHGIGMTDIVKRTTRRADELATDEYRTGMDRLERMTAWLAPRRVCFVGLAGWRVAVDRKATSGWQNHRLGNRPVYVMPSTSGLNASSQLDDLTAHLREATA